MHRYPATLCGEIWGITTYFNPAGYVSKLTNLHHFARRIRRQGLRLLVVELSYSDAAFDLPDDVADMVVRFNTSVVLWQKERLLNLAISHLPESCDKVIWLDADIFFMNDAWIEETAALLQSYMVVQPYHLAGWLPAGCIPRTLGDIDASIRASIMYRPGVAFANLWYPPGTSVASRFEQAHPGFAWTARRNVLAEHGLYDRFVLGGGDLVIAAAIHGPSSDWNTHRLRDSFHDAQLRDIAQWTDAFHHAVQGSVSCTRGEVMHLWHGAMVDRKYIERYYALKQCEFDPVPDIALDKFGCWRWNSDKPLLHRLAQEYFLLRKEDN